MEDAEAALAFLRDTSAAHACRVDGHSIAAAGVSFGSWIAMQATAADAGVSCVAGALPVDMGALGRAAEDTGVRAALLEMFAAVDEDASLGFELRGGAEGLMAELIGSGTSNALPSVATALADRPILLIGAEADELAPPGLHLRPFTAALSEAGAAAVTVRMFPGGHELADAAYASVLAEWLLHTCLEDRAAPP